MRPFLRLSVLLLASACQQSPTLPLVRALDQAASWAAAVEYAVRLEADRSVPPAYLEVVIKTAAEDLQTVMKTIAELEDVPAELQTAAVASCDALIGTLSPAAQQPQSVDVASLKRVEGELRALAKRIGSQ